MPDKIKNMNDLIVIAVMVGMEPTINTIIKENSNTMAVLIAVAMSESVFLIPHFARMDVIPAKKADKIAIKSHINIKSLSFLFRTLYHGKGTSATKNRCRKTRELGIHITKRFCRENIWRSRMKRLMEG